MLFIILILLITPVSATEYYFTHYDLGDVNQNDSTPCVGASGKDLCYLQRQGVQTMALTVDIRKKLWIKFWQKVFLLWDKWCTGIFQVEDEMNKRFRTRCIKREGVCIKWDMQLVWGKCSIHLIR